MNLTFINIGTLEFSILISAAIIPLILMIYCIVDLLKRDFKGKSIDQILIFFLLLFTPLLGVIIYLAILRANYPLKKTNLDFINS